ncbi:hypothetical protein KP509_12G017600 [Ceratopteris richardii]|uniref:Secreted protein n=1 Tax=Ceratopteris richardii TaxID=49495 RepID=A0A8T2TJJ3_CERRI|nr:hypothetical protein KP509_12G017600 [Ceratopteris richardii]
MIVLWLIWCLALHLVAEACECKSIIHKDTVSWMRRIITYFWQHLVAEACEYKTILHRTQLARCYEGLFRSNLHRELADVPLGYQCGNIIVHNSTGFLNVNPACSLV